MSGARKKRIMDDTTLGGVLCFLSGENWFQGQFIDTLERKSFGILGVEQECDPCCQEDGYSEFQLSITDYESKKRAKVLVAKRGGDFANLSSPDDSVSFRTRTMLCDTKAQTVMAKYFPSVLKTVSEEDLQDCVVCIGNADLSMSALEFTPIDTSMSSGALPPSSSTSTATSDAHQPQVPCCSVTNASSKPPNPPSSNGSNSAWVALDTMGSLDSERESVKYCAKGKMVQGEAHLSTTSNTPPIGSIDKKSGVVKRKESGSSSNSPEESMNGGGCAKKRACTAATDSPKSTVGGGGAWISRRGGGREKNGVVPTPPPVVVPPLISPSPPSLS